MTWKFLDNFIDLERRIILCDKYVKLTCSDVWIEALTVFYSKLENNKLASLNKFLWTYNDRFEDHKTAKGTFTLLDEIKYRNRMGKSCCWVQEGEIVGEIEGDCSYFHPRSKHNKT